MFITELLRELPKRGLETLRAFDSTLALSSQENARSAARLTKARLELNQIASENNEPLSRSA